jgi:hypothetical protein
VNRTVAVFMDGFTEGLTFEKGPPLAVDRYTLTEITRPPELLPSWRALNSRAEALSRRFRKLLSVT